MSDKLNLRKQLRLGILLLVTLSFSTHLKAQDPIYSQFYNAPLQVNPAFAGNTFAPVFALNYRNQWPGLPNAYNTFSASYDQFFDRFNSGVGVFLLGDNAGDGIIRTFRGSGIYSYRVFLNRAVQAKIGVEASFTQVRLDWDKLVFFDQLDPRFGSTTPGGVEIPSLENRPASLSKNYFDISIGALVYSTSYYGGISLKHLASPDDRLLAGSDSGFYAGIPMRVSVHAGAQLPIDGYNNERSSAFISPSVLFVKQSDLKQLNVGALFTYHQLMLGGWYRHSFGNADAFIFSAGWRSGLYRVNYSFDMTVSALGLSRTVGSHEIGVVINLENAYDRPSRYNDCFNIFR